MGAQVVPSASHGMPALEVAEPNPPHIISRTTKGGRTLWYCLKVIQQPERARACGSGPKSSADRRPVDPPPVVELRVYEGHTWEAAQDKDITFLYNANFFLYATLEHARVMAHGRVQTPAANTPPVLTGMPVSGMAYLDRPTEAGYFLFPDLSVRHEGRYRLTFSLYEETKEDKDKDPQSDSSASEGQSSGQSSSPAQGGSFDFRMEAKSQDFVVYSAKKFPGLAESTALSRMVAEQGCRVRIRRDVRMRRRDGKGAGDYDNGDDEYARRRSRRTATPVADARPDLNRNRSMSGSAERAPYPADSQRRPSMADYPSQFPGQPGSQGGHLQFLNGGPNGQYPSQPPPQNFAQPPSVPASPVYPPSQAAPYSSQTSYQAAPPPPPPSYRQRERTPSQSSYAPLNSAPRRDSAQPQGFRSSSGHVTLPPLVPALPQHNSHRMPPPKMPSLPPIQVDGPQTSTLPGASQLPLPSPTALQAARPNFPAPAAGPVDHIMTTQYAGSKRAHDQSFKTADQPRRFQDGARDEGSSEDPDAGLGPMIYSRAAGFYTTVPADQCPE